ncbi:Hypothetical protein CINCED_3A013762 [Cinara cedri]|nr:Hypothetical protein CINCED_3A013762 [Cinara cedri]
MDELKQFGKALMQYKSYKERQEHLIKSLDHLSYYFPEVYSQILREIKKREIESNDPNKITKWLNISTSKTYYVQLHEALMLVNNNNTMAKEQYTTSIKHMLCQTIEKNTNIEFVIKICDLIEKSSHLQTIYENLKHLIHQVKQLNGNKFNTRMDSQTENMTGHFDSLNIEGYQTFQQQPIPVWPTMIQPNNLKQHGLPHFNLECFGYENFEMKATANQYPNFSVTQTLPNLTIVNQEMDGAVMKWLHYLKLHKYQWFFNSLSYLEIEFIDEDNIEGFITKVNKNSITKGAQKKICVSTKALRDRQSKLNNLLMVLDLEVTPVELCELITYMRDILHYPIPNKNCVVGDQIQKDIVLIMDKILDHLMEKLSATRYLVSNSLLGSSINKYMECTFLIAGNQIFMKDQVEKILLFRQIIEYKVNHMPRNFM